MENTPLAAEARYETFVKNVATSGILWALRNSEGWANWSDEDGHVFPVWDQRQAAEQCAREAFPGYQPTEVPVISFIAKQLPLLCEQGFFVGINLTPEMVGLSISCDEMKRILGPGAV